MSPWHPVFEGGRFAKGCVATEASAYAAVRLGPSGGGSLCAVSAEAGDAEKVVTSAMEQAIATMHFFLSILTDGEEGAEVERRNQSHSEDAFGCLARKYEVG